MAKISPARSLHDVGLATWFGGSLMGAVGLNGAAATLDDPRQRGRAVNAGWTRWAPVNAAAIGAHLIGGALIVRANSHRIAGQKGVAGWTTAKTALTGAAVAAQIATGWYAAKVWREGDVPLEGGTEPAGETPAEAAAALKKLAYLQWVTPALTGAILVSSAVMGEQQRPSEVVKGIAARGTQVLSAAAQHPAAAVVAARHALS